MIVIKSSPNDRIKYFKNKYNKNRFINNIYNKWSYKAFYNVRHNFYYITRQGFKILISEYNRFNVPLSQAIGLDFSNTITTLNQNCYREYHSIKNANLY